MRTSKAIDDMIHGRSTGRLEAERKRGLTIAQWGRYGDAKKERDKERKK